MIDRIVLLNDISVPAGGATALTLASAIAFRARGHEVTLLTGDAGINPALAAAGVTVAGIGQARLTASAFGKALVGGLYNAAAARFVRDWIAANDTPGTVYHLHGWAQILSPAIFGALRPVIDRVVLSAHDFFLACPNGSYAFLKTGAVCPLTPMSPRCIAAQCDRRNYLNKLWRVTRQAVQRQLYDRRNSPPILAIHERMRPFLMRAGIPGAAIQALPNPVRPFSATRIAAEHNREVLFVGRLEATKGPDLAAAACRRAGATLRLIGAGAMRARLEAEYPEMIFAGHQPPDAIAAMAARARMLVMPSRYPEPYGLVAAEALWSGLPVIAPPTAFLTPDIVAAGAGLGCEPRDTGALATAIGGILSDDGRAATMSRAAFERTRTIALTYDVWIDRLLEAYERRLGSATAAIAPTRVAMIAPPVQA